MRAILERLGLIERRPKSDLSEKLVRLGVNHFVRDYPNAIRDDCPSLETLDRLIEKEGLPSDDIREHLFVCSECFSHYREELARRRVSEATVPVREETGKPYLVPVLATTVAAILAFTAMFVWLQRKDEHGGANASLIADASPAEEGGPSRPTLRSVETAPTTSQQPSVINTPDISQSSFIGKKNVVDFPMGDLPGRSEGSAQHTLVLTQADNEITLRLPERSRPGSYRVTLTDSQGTQWRSMETIGGNGNHLHLDFDLSSLKPGKYVICLIREEAIPHCVPAIVKPAPR